MSKYTGKSLAEREEENSSAWYNDQLEKAVPPEDTNDYGKQLQEPENKGDSEWENNFSRPSQGKKHNKRIKIVTTGILTTGLIGGLAGMMVILSSSGPFQLLNLANNVKNAFSQSARVHSAKDKQNWNRRLDEEKVAKDCKKPASDKCQVSTVDTSNLDRMRQQGIEVETKELESGRHQIISMRMPGSSSKITSGAQLEAAVTQNPAWAKAFQNAIDSRMANVNGPRSFTALANKGLNKLDFHTLNVKNATGEETEGDGQSLKERYASRTGQVPEVGDTNADGEMYTAEEKKKKEEARDKKIATNSDKASGNIKDKLTDTIKFKDGGAKSGAAKMLEMSCSVYKGANMASNAVVTYSLWQHAKVAILLMSAAESVTAGGDDPTTIETAANMLFLPTTVGEDAGKSAVESALFLGLMNGASGVNIEKMQTMLYGKGKSIKTINEILEQTHKVIGGPKNAQRVCKLSGLAAEGVALGVCAVSAVGTAIAGGVGGLACAAMMLASGLTEISGIKQSINERLAEFTAKIVDDYVLPMIVQSANTVAIDTDTRGPIVMDGLMIGSWYFFDVVHRTGAGGYLTNSTSYMASINMTRESDNFYKQVDIAAARDTPFDIYNKYSVAGSIASTMLNTNNGNIDPSTPILALLKAVNPTNYTPSALAYASQPLPYSDADFSQSNCVMQDHIYGDIKCGSNGLPGMGYNTGLTASGNIVQTEFADSVDFLIANKYINDPEKKGAQEIPESKKEKMDFIKQYCIETTDNVPGTTELPYDDKGYDYATNEGCMKQDQDTVHILNYLMTKNLQDDIDNQGNTGVGESSNGFQLVTDPSVLQALPRGVASTIDGHKNGKIPEDQLTPISFAPGHKLYKPAAEGLEMLNKQFKADLGFDIPFTDSYRPYEVQVSLKEQKPRLAATPGTSNHGLGMALDLGGSGVNNDFGGEMYTWMTEHGWKYGWKQPDWAVQGGSKPEPWHWEFGLGHEGIEPKN